MQLNFSCILGLRISASRTRGHLVSGREPARAARPHAATAADKTRERLPPRRTNHAAHAHARPQPAPSRARVLTRRAGPPRGATRGRRGARARAPRVQELLDLTRDEGPGPTPPRLLECRRDHERAKLLPPPPPPSPEARTQWTNTAARARAEQKGLYFLGANLGQQLSSNVGTTALSSSVRGAPRSEPEKSVAQSRPGNLG